MDLAITTPPDLVVMAQQIHALTAARIDETE